MYFDQENFIRRSINIDLLDRQDLDQMINGAVDYSKKLKIIDISRSCLLKSTIFSDDVMSFKNIAYCLDLGLQMESYLLM